MNWDAIGAIAEGVGSVAVVATLIYLAIQMRTANKQRELESFRYVNVRFEHICESFSQSVERASIINRGRNSLSNLNDDERLIFEYLYYQLLNSFEVWYLQLMRTSSAGAHRDQQLDNILASIKSQLDYPGIRDFWYKVKHQYLPVQQIIDDALSANEADD